MIYSVRIEHKLCEWKCEAKAAVAALAGAQAACHFPASQGSAVAAHAAKAAAAGPQGHQGASRARSAWKPTTSTAQCPSPV